MATTRVAPILLACATALSLTACGPDHSDYDRSMVRSACYRAVKKKLKHEQAKAPARFSAENMRFKDSWNNPTLATMTGTVEAGEVQHRFRCTTKSKDPFVGWGQTHVAWTD